MRLSHAEAQALVSARLDGPLDPVAERELNVHLATCDSCRAFNSSATNLARSMQTMPYLPASPAVTRAVLDHVSAPRSGWTVLAGGLPERALPVATAIAAAMIIVFVGAFAIFRSLGNDDPETIPAQTETTLAQQPNSTETFLGTSTDGTEAPVETQADLPTDEPATEVQTEPIVTDAPEDAPTEESPKTTEPEATDEAVVAALLPTDDVAVTAEAETPAPEATDPVDVPATEEQTEPAETPTEEVEPIGPSGNTTFAGESSPEDQTGERSTEEPATATPEPTATNEPTAEPTATSEPTPTSEPTEETTAEPTATEEPSPTPTTEPEPTAPLIQQRGETPTANDDDDDGAETPTPEEPTAPDEITIAPVDGTDDGENGAGDDNGGEQVIEPSQGTLSGDDGAATAESDDPNGFEAADDAGDGGQENVGSAEITLGSAPVYLGIDEVPGDSSRRLGLDADGQLIFSPNPGRVSLTESGVTVSQGEGESGQFVQACDESGACINASSASQGDGFYTDTPIGWLNGEIVYERLNGDDYPVEFRTVSVDVQSGAIGEDRLLGGGDGGWETLVRPYPVGNGLLVPAQSVWLYVTPDGVSAIDDNPFGDMVLYRVTPTNGIVSYVSGGEIILATVDAPGTAIARIPFDGVDYDFSPNGDQVAVISGVGIDIWDTSGNLVTTYANPEGISAGGIVWLNQGIAFVDYSSGVVRILEP